MGFDQTSIDPEDGWYCIEIPKATSEKEIEFDLDNPRNEPRKKTSGDEADDEDEDDEDDEFMGQDFLEEFVWKDEEIANMAINVEDCKRFYMPPRPITKLRFVLEKSVRHIRPKVPGGIFGQMRWVALVEYKLVKTGVNTPERFLRKQHLVNSLLKKVTENRSTILGERKISTQR